MLLPSSVLRRESSIPGPVPLSGLLTTQRWWHEWRNDQFDELAASLVAGHLIECGAYVTGGFYSDFKQLMKTGKHVNMGFPIAEIEANGVFNIVKEKNTGGCVTVGSCASQLLYEIQGP